MFKKYAFTIEMFDLCMFLFVAVLFFILTPGILLSLPPGGSLVAKAAFHGLVFALVYHLTHKMAWKAMHSSRYMM
jgi:hypothetical protein